MTRSRLLPAALAATCLLAASPAAHAASKTDVTFQSAGLGLSGAPAELRGQLAKPDGAGPFPAVVLLHTCGGVREHVSDLWPDFLTGQGYVTLTVDSFGSRNLDVCPVEMKVIEMARDAYGALKYLSGLSYVDRNGIAAMGFSLGAMAINRFFTRSGFQRRVRKKLGLDFAAVVSMYGPCDTLLEGASTPFPLIQILGENDIYTEKCQKLGSGPIKVHILAGAWHNFDDEESSGTEDYTGNLRQYSASATKKSMEIVKDFLGRHTRRAGAGMAARPAGRRSRMASAAPAGKAAGAAGGGGGSGEAIRAAVTGRTIKYSPPHGGGTVSVFFKGDGSVLGRNARNPGRTFRKKWWVKGKILCRTVGRKNREVCNKISVSGETAKFFARNGKLLYEAKLLQGNRLAE
jgi:dienelactone hydrolase